MLYKDEKNQIITTNAWLQMVSIVNINNMILICGVKIFWYPLIPAGSATWYNHRCWMRFSVMIMHTVLNPSASWCKTWISWELTKLFVYCLFVKSSQHKSQFFLKGLYNLCSTQHSNVKPLVSKVHFKMELVYVYLHLSSRFSSYVKLVLCCVSQQWYDHYLQWNQSEYPGVKNLRFTADQVWTPDILLYNRYVTHKHTHISSTAADAAAATAEL